MTFQPELQPTQPPLVAEWLLTLFIPSGVAESLTGDLLEEFSILVRQSGGAFARRWYWRQTLKTIVHGGGAALRSAPWLVLVTIAGLWAIGFATSLSAHAMRQFLDGHRVYESHPDAYLFWLKFPLEIGRVIVCALVGTLVASIVKNAEMIAAMTLALLQIVLFLTSVFAVILTGHEWFHWFLVMLPWNSLCPIATVIGGAIIRALRCSATMRPATQ